MSIYIQLFHGRQDPEEELEDWGFEGPILGPFPYFHITYGDHIKLGDETIMIDGKEIDFPTWDKDGYINFLGGYYGDMSIISEDVIKDDLLERNKITNEVLKIPHNEIPKLINHKEEWVKVYIRSVLNNKEST